MTLVLPRQVRSRLYDTLLSYACLKNWIALYIYSPSLPHCLFLCFILVSVMSVIITPHHTILVYTPPHPNSHTPYSMREGVKRSSLDMTSTKGYSAMHLAGTHTSLSLCLNVYLAVFHPYTYKYLCPGLCQCVCVCLCVSNLSLYIFLFMSLGIFSSPSKHYISVCLSSSVLSLIISLSPPSPCLAIECPKAVCKEITFILRSMNVDTTILCNDGHTAYQLAIMHGNMEFIESFDRFNNEDELMDSESGIPTILKLL